jgi:hypothetical protein
MLSNDTRNTIKNITAGNVIEGSQDTCTTIRNYLCAGFETGTTVKTDFEGKLLIKKEQAGLLEAFSKKHDLWLTEIPVQTPFFARGGEAMVYLDSDNRNVIKQNDAIYYATWLEFCNSLVLHNLIFPNTSYTFLGFTKSDDILYAVLRQPYIKSDSSVNIEDIKKHLEFNGFENHIRHDYRHVELGLLLEDMHDENVIVNTDILFFIDTVFYIVTPLVI